MTGSQEVRRIVLAVQQRVLPAYRAPFFTALAQACPGALALYAGRPGEHEGILPASEVPGADLRLEDNRELFRGYTPLWQVWQPGLLSWLREVDPRVLVVEANPRNRSLAGAIGWMHARSRPVIGWGLGAPGATGRLGRWRTTAWRGFLARFDGLIAYSRQGAETYRRAGFPADRVFVAPNAAAPRPSSPPARPIIPGRRPTVLFVGRLQARKRVDGLLEACAALPEALRPRLVIVGDGPERPALEALARRVYPSAEFTGARQGAELEAYYAVADLFVLPGTGGLAVQQALAAGLPVAAAEADGTQADLVRPENGWRLPPGDLPALQRTLSEALSDLPRLRRMGEASFRIASEEVSLEAMVAAFLEAVERVRMKDEG